MIDARRGGDPDKSYVARLFSKGTDAILKKIGEEATEAVMAGKDGDPRKIVDEVADLWFHSMLLLAQFDLKPADVLAELERREGLSGLEEFAARKLQDREERRHMNQQVHRARATSSRSLKTVGHVSYLLHPIVAVGAVLPGAQASVALLIVAFIIDLVKKDERRRHLAGVALPLAHPHRAVGRRAVPGDRAAVAAAVRCRAGSPGRVISIWFLYRVVRGWMNLNANHADAELSIAWHHDPNCIFCKIVAGKIPVEEGLRGRRNFSPSTTSTPGRRCMC